MRRILYILALLCSFCAGQGTWIRSTTGASCTPSFTQTQAFSRNTSCSTATSCAVTLNQSIGAGHLVVISAAPSNFGIYITGTDNGGTYQPCFGCGLPSANDLADSMDGGYILSASAQASPITVNFSGTSGGAQVDVREYTPAANCTAVFDAGGNFVENSVTTNSFPGVALTLTGTNDVIVQSAGTPQKVTSVNSPWSTHGELGSTWGVGVGDNINTASGAAPTWTSNSGVTYNSGIAMAFGSGFTLPSSTITPDRISQSVVTVGSSISWTHYTGSGSNRLLYVNVFSTTNAPTGCTYNSVSMGTAIWSLTDGALVDKQTAFMLVNPSAGAHTVTCSFGASNDGTFGHASSWNGVNQSTPHRTCSTATDGGAQSNPATVTATTVAGDVVIDGVEADELGTTTFAPNHIGIFTVNQNLGQLVATGSQYFVATGTSTVMSWTFEANISWTEAACALIPA